MTLVVAFRASKGGVLLCSDRQEDDGISKKSIDKIYHARSLKSCDVFMTAAGPSGPLKNTFTEIHKSLKQEEDKGNEVAWVGYLMSIGGYFVTEEQEMAKRYGIRQKGRELQKHLATLKSELNDYFQAWSNLGRTFDGAEHNTFSWETQTVCIRVTRPDPKHPVLPGRQQSTNEIACVGMRYFHGDGLETLLADLEKTKAELKTVSKQCEDMGDPL
jgi:hypothetical protein